MEKSLRDVKLRDDVSIQHIRTITKTKDLGYTLKKRTWKHAEHLARLGKDRWNKIVAEWTPYEGKKNRGRPSVTWRDEITRFTGIMWERTGQNRAS